MKSGRTLVATVYTVVVAGCSDGNPIVLESTSAVSSDGRWEATLEKVDNGLGFGMGRLLYEVHVQPTGTAVTAHGDSSVTSVFYVDALSQAEKYKPEIRWGGPNQLMVKYVADENLPAAKTRPEVAGILIGYEAVRVEQWP